MTRRFGRAAIVVLVSALGLAAACSQNQNVVTVRSLDHAGRIAFVCLDRSKFGLNDPSVLVDLSRCDGVVYTDDQLMGGAPLPQYTLHALVTQEARGEIAAVDLAADVVLDSQSLVPGYTFGAIGELPSALAVQTIDPEYLFVATPGQLDILAKSIRAFLPEERRGVAPADAARIMVGSAVTDLVLSPDGTRLYAAVPERGSLLEIAIQRAPDPVFGTVREIPLADVVPDLSAVPTDDPYCVACENDLECSGFTDPVDGYVPRVAASLGTTPRPLALGVDETEGLLLVADGNLPIVHVLDLTAAGGAAELDPMAVGSPTTDIAVTPAVPRERGDTTATARYLYAIDAIERTVIAAEYSVDETTGAATAVVAPVDVRGGRSGDRIDVGAGARVIDVIVTNEYADTVARDALATRPCPSETGPGLLRGVFLAIGATDGGVHIVDVYDLDAVAGCRFPIDTSVATRPCTATKTDTGWVRRHRQRLSLPDVSGIRFTSPPVIAVGSVSYTIEDDGLTVSDPTLGLVPPAMGCPTGYDNESTGPICLSADPWALLPETWAATWEGFIPGTQGGRGRLLEEADGWALEGEVAFCDRGVLGRDDTSTLSAGAPEAGYVGDILVVTAELPPRDLDVTPEGERAECERLFGYAPAEIDPVVDLVDFPILHAMTGRVELGPARFQTPGTNLPTSPFVGLSPEEIVARCFDELVTYEVRSQGAYTVLGGVSGMLHRVVADEATGACVVDETRDPRRFARAFVNRPFENGIVWFHLRPASTVDPMTGETVTVAFPTRGSQVVFGFTIGGTPARTSAAAGAIINDLVYSAADGRLYSADVGGVDGLSQFDLTPFTHTKMFQ